MFQLDGYAICMLVNVYFDVWRNIEKTKALHSIISAFVQVNFMWNFIKTVQHVLVVTVLQ